MPYGRAKFLAVGALYLNLKTVFPLQPGEGTGRRTEYAGVDRRRLHCREDPLGNVFRKLGSRRLRRSANDQPDHAGKRRITQRLTDRQLPRREGGVVVAHGRLDRGMLGTKGLHEHSASFGPAPVRPATCVTR